MKRGLVLGLLILLGVGGLATAQSLEGRWTLDIEINPQEAVFADAIDLVQRGVVYRYSTNGIPVDTMKVGVIPGSFCFK